MADFHKMQYIFRDLFLFSAFCTLAGTKSTPLGGYA